MAVRIGYAVRSPLRSPGMAASVVGAGVWSDGRARRTASCRYAGINAEGYREILGIQVATGESTASWLGFFRDLVARGLISAGPVGLVTSDAHAGLV